MSAPIHHTAATRRSPPHSPTYAEALRAPKPAPINTSGIQGGFSNDLSTASTFSPANVSSGWGSFRSSRTPATSLYPSSIWSPIPDTIQSATIPKTLSWDTTPAPAMPVSPNAYVHRSSVGLGLGGQSTAQAQASVTNAMQHSPTWYQYQQSKLTEAQTHPYRLEVTDPNASTFPMMQRPFGTIRGVADQHRITSNPFQSPTSAHPSTVPIGTEMKAAASKRVSPVRNVSVTPTNKEYGALNNPARPDSVTDQSRDSSGVSAISDLTVLTTSSSAKSSNIELVEQESHPKGFARFLREGYKLDNIVEAYDGAYTTLKSLNGQFLELPSNARVICIKTEYVTNIHWSIKNKTWAAMSKVGTRIMRVWEASKEDPGSKVFLLLSVNGQKSYCGLAEMSGDFTEGGVLPGWYYGGNKQVWGTMPVTWHSLKNVSYSWFGDIHHSHNDGPITNMWNGMHFPSPSGLEVLRRYSRRPHFTNLLCWEKNGPYFPLKGNTQPEQIDPALDKLRARTGQRWIKGRSPQLLLENKPADENSDHATRATPATGANSTPIGPTSRANGRESCTGDTPDAGRKEKEGTPSMLDRRGSIPLSVNTSTPPHFDGNSSPGHQPGQMVTCVVDANGKYVPVNPGEGQISHVTIPGHDTPLVVHTYFHSPTTEPQYTSQTTPTPTPAQDSFMGGRGNGSIYSPVHSTRAGSGAGSLRSHRSFYNQGPQVMNENLRATEDFVAPRGLRPAKSYNNMPPRTPTHAPGSRVVTAFHNPTASATFAPQRGLPRDDSDSNMTVIPTSSPFSKAPDNAIVPRKMTYHQSRLHPSGHFNVDPYIWKLQKAPMSEIESNSGGTSVTVPSYGSRSDFAQFDDAALEAERAKCIVASKRAMAITHEIAHRDYLKDPRRTINLGSSERFEGSEPGGWGCVVSNSSIEKERISPVPSLGGSFWDAEKERIFLEREMHEREIAEWESRLHADMERILGTPEPSVVADSEFDGDVGEGGVRLD